MKPGRFIYNLKYSFIPFKPRLILQIIKNYLKIFLLKKQPLRYIDIAVDYKCNLNCQHCSAIKLTKHNTRKLTLDDYKDIAKQCYELGLITIGFTGGEPLLCKELPGIIKAFQPHRAMVSIQTNGTLLTTEKIKELTAIGVDMVTVSIDSSDAKEHDEFRGVDGAFEKSLQNIKDAMDNGLKVIICTTLSHGNINSPGLIKLIELTEDMGTLLVFTLATPAGKWSNNEEILLKGDDWNKLASLLEKYPHTRRDFGSNYWTLGCGGGVEKLYFTPYGDVIPCPFIHISFGNVMEEPVKHIRNRMLKTELAGFREVCLAAEDENYIRKRLSLTFDKKELPISYREAYGEL